MIGNGNGAGNAASDAVAGATTDTTSTAPVTAPADAAPDAAAHTAVLPAPIGFWEAFRFWLKLGFISFGGPAGQIAIMHAELVERRRWISEKRFLHALNYCMLLPGPEAQQLATYIGWLMHRSWGGIVAGGLFVLPSLFILIGLSWIYVAFGQLAVVAGLFYGIKPAVTALVVHAAHRIGTRALKNGGLWAIAAAAFVAIFALDAPFPLIVLLAAAVGHVGGRLAPRVFVVGGGHGAAASSHGPALIDDDTPTPSHARFTKARLATVLGVGGGLWLAAMALLMLIGQGAEGALAQMGWFFTKAALLTFGGAYAVLPYVYQGAVEQHQWLTGTQMIDGLALGETTPGPLIMVVAFVGFVGGWAKQVFGPDALFLAGAAAAGVVSFFTFLPSFVFIFAGGPLIETTHGKLKFTAPLTAITAAVVGVILNLAVFFAYHVLWPKGFGGGFDAVSALIAAAAGIALFRFKLGVMPLLALCALLGLALTLLPPLLQFH
jgi:chromate transporter